MLLKDALEDKTLDYRIRDRLIQEGKLAKEDVENYLAKLDDDSQNGENKKID